jgi:hypothetical protein
MRFLVVDGGNTHVEMLAKIHTKCMEIPSALRGRR